MGLADEQHVCDARPGALYHLLRACCWGLPLSLSFARARAAHSPRTPRNTLYRALQFQEGQSTISWLAGFITNFTAIFYCLFLLYMVLFYVPQIRATNTDIVSKKSILLLLPFVVINGVPALAQAVQEIFAEDESSGANAVSGTGSSSSDLKDYFSGPDAAEGED